MYRTKKYGLVSSKTEHQILAELEHYYDKKTKNKKVKAKD